VAVIRARKAELAERRTRLIQYRIDGRSYEEIYQELGYSSPNAASKDFCRVLEMNIAEQHAIGMDAAALIHAKTCTAPNPATLPGCDCTPEPAPAPEPPPGPPPLPASWIKTEDGG
jgi:hypothetical protein